MNTIDLIKALTQAPGPSAGESLVAPLIADIWRPFVDDINVDRFGTLVAVKHGQPAGGDTPRRRVLLAAHMDEIGLMVREIVSFPKVDGNGFLRVSKIGGVDPRQMYGQLVTVHGREQLTGIVGALPVHMLPAERQGKSYRLEDMFVDSGLTAAALRELVAIGDFVTFDQPTRELTNNTVAGKAFDNRASVAAVTICLEYLQTRTHSWDVLAVATAQEETGLKGAMTSAHALNPDLAVALDVTHAKSAGVKDSDALDLGGGPVLEIGPNIHPGVTKRLRDAAAALEMATQVGVHTRSSGTDAYRIQSARAGIPTSLISIPLRYMHTVVETASTKDIERTGRLLGEFVARLDDNSVDELSAVFFD